MRATERLIFQGFSALMVLVVASLLVALPQSAHADERVLFVGNSYTFFSAPNELKAVVRELLKEVAKPGATVHTQEVSAGGYQLHQPATDAKTPGSGLHTALQEKWNAVILQEQSQIPAFKAANHPSYTKSVQGFLALNTAVEKTGGVTIALLTWGRRDGDQQNAWLSPFSKMQEHLTAGYQHYAKVASTPTRKVYIAPAGPAFAQIHDSIAAGGGNPLKSDSLFVRLYDGDGSHPSTTGSYLAGLVVFATLTGVDVTTTKWAPPNVSAADAMALRMAAKAVVVDGPWKTTTPGPDAGSTDAGTTDAGSTDAGGEDVAASGDAGFMWDSSSTTYDTVSTDAPAATDTATTDVTTADVATADATSDAGTTVDTVGSTPKTTQPVDSDSGCTAGPTGDRSFGLFWLLVLAGALIVRRRRFALQR